MTGCIASRSFLISAHAKLFLFLFLYCRVRCFLIAAAVGVGRSRSVSIVNDLAAGYQFLNTCLFQHILKLVSRSKYDCIPDYRNPLFISHTIHDMVRQRVGQIICGYEDANDCDSLRHDSILKWWLVARHQITIYILSLRWHAWKTRLRYTSCTK